MKTKIQDMTSGSPGRLIILFAIPLMLGNICQQLYTMVDTMVVGQVAGVEALAALGAVDFLMWVVTGISTGLTQGFSIQLSQYYGAKDGSQLPADRIHRSRSIDSQPVICFAGINRAAYTFQYYRNVSVISAYHFLWNPGHSSL
mgnify:CR=1 FL=1